MLFADSNTDAGVATANNLNSYFQSNINGTIVNPIQTTTAGKTVDGTASFSGQVSCAGAAPKSFLDLTMTNSPTGDVVISAQIDRTFSGTKNYSYTAPLAASGICQNGIISCDAGTWNNCNYYSWGYNGTITLTQQPPINMGGCFCINNSCGGLAAQAPGSILQDVGNSLTAQMMAYNKNYSVTKVNTTTAMASYWGQDMSTCVNTTGATLPSVNPTTTYALPGLATAETVAANDPSSAWTSLNAGSANADLGLTSQQCTISNSLYPTVTQVCPTGMTWSSYANVCYDSGHASTDINSANATCSGLSMVLPTGAQAKYLPNYNGATIFSSDTWFQVSGGCGSYPRTDWVTAYNGTTVTNLLENTWCNGVHYNSPKSAFRCVAPQIPQTGMNLLTNDQCAGSETNSNCKITDQSVCDSTGTTCVATISNSVNTGVQAPEMCYTQLNSGIAYLICANSSGINYVGSDGSSQSFSTSPSGFIVKRTYQCQANNQFDMSSVEKAHESVVVNEGTNNQDFSYTASQQDANGNWQTSSDSGTINYTPPPQIQYCKTKASVVNQQVVYSDGTNKTNATTSQASNQFTIKQCTGNTYNTCPLNTGETVYNPCGSINDMGEVIGVMEGVAAAANDMICSQN